MKFFACLALVDLVGGPPAFATIEQCQQINAKVIGKIATIGNRKSWLESAKQVVPPMRPSPALC
jgi:hypothetical protein